MNYKYIAMSASLEFDHGKLRNGLVCRYYHKEKNGQETVTRFNKSGWTSWENDMEAFMKVYAAIAARPGAQFETVTWVPGVVEYTVRWTRFINE